MSPGVASIEVDGSPVDARIRWLVSGKASATTLALSEPLSFWGGFEAETGRIIDRRHPQLGATLTGCVVVMRAGRGSSSASSVIAEAIRAGTAPAAVVMEEVDEIIALGAIVAEELYGLTMPVIVVDPAAFAILAGSAHVTIDDGVTEG